MRLSRELKYLGGAALVAVLGCTPTQTPVASRYVKSTPVAASEGASITVNPEESAELAGATLVIPPGALPQDTTITVEVGLDPVIEGNHQPLGPVAVWGPDGTRFAERAEMTLPFKLPEGVLPEDLFVQVVEADGTRLELGNELLAVDLQAGVLRFKVDGFTSFQPGAWACLADSACPSGKVCKSGRCRPPGPVACGDNQCASGEFCCNASCGICAPSGGACTQQVCCTANTDCPQGNACVDGSCRPIVVPECSQDADCRVEADYCTGCDCRALAKGESIPACPGPGVQCFADPCLTLTAACVNGTCQAVKKAPSCTQDSDCRLEADYCTGCDCRALAKGESLPYCPGPGVQCFADPCLNLTTACVSGTCQVMKGGSL